MLRVLNTRDCYNLKISKTCIKLCKKKRTDRPILNIYSCDSKTVLDIQHSLSLFQYPSSILKHDDVWNKVTHIHFTFVPPSSYYCRIYKSENVSILSVRHTTKTFVSENKKWQLRWNSYCFVLVLPSLLVDYYF